MPNNHLVLSLAFLLASLSLYSNDFLNPSLSRDIDETLKTSGTIEDFGKVSDLDKIRESGLDPFFEDLANVDDYESLAPDTLAILDGTKERRTEALNNFVHLKPYRGGISANCTGTLVAGCVLTAAHCLDLKSIGQPASHMAIYVRGTRLETLALSPKNYKIHKKYKADNATHDIALLNVSGKGGFPFSVISRDKLKPGIEVFIDGFGEIQYSERKEDSALYTGTSYFGAYTSFDGGPKTVLTMSRAQPMSNFPLLRNLISVGDSGGPAFITKDVEALDAENKAIPKKAYKIVGIASLLQLDGKPVKKIPFVSYHSSFYDPDNYEFVKSNLAWCQTEVKLTPKEALVKALEARKKAFKDVVFLDWLKKNKEDGEKLRGFIHAFLVATGKIKKENHILYAVYYPERAPLLRVKWVLNDDVSGYIDFELIDDRIKFQSSYYSP